MHRFWYGSNRSDPTGLQKVKKQDMHPFDRFKEFVSKVLTVTKEDVQKMEAEIAEKVEKARTASDLPEPEE